jgi:hypothetical protein
MYIDAVPAENVDALFFAEPSARQLKRQRLVISAVMQVKSPPRKGLRVPQKRNKGHTQESRSGTSTREESAIKAAFSNKKRSTITKNYSGNILFLRGDHM